MTYMKIPEKASITLKDAPDIRLGVKRRGREH